MHLKRNINWLPTEIYLEICLLSTHHPIPQFTLCWRVPNTHVSRQPCYNFLRTHFFKEKIDFTPKVRNLELQPDQQL